jgi:hypothetical protein
LVLELEVLVPRSGASAVRWVGDGGILEALSAIIRFVLLLEAPCFLYFAFVELQFSFPFFSFEPVILLCNFNDY